MRREGRRAARGAEPVRLRGLGSREQRAREDERQPEGWRTSGKCPVEEALDRSADGAGDATEVNVPAAYEQRLRRGHGHIVRCAAAARQYFPIHSLGKAADLHGLSSRDRVVRDSVTLLPGRRLRASIPINPMGKVGIR
ncbi:hypothetical protein GCM10010425_71030 [Streptomyces spororaveus]|uniref:Uncharacterized protein n=1 Tax=Streptomyces spororaveus TaxID=284039 RepID=A0ABQ3T5Y9_9ACTN|nr:hypothetical protein Sspor_13470 [Streptomyces spororaveus]